MSLIKDNNRKCQECGNRNATKALVIPQKLKWYVCDECSLAYTQVMLDKGCKLTVSDGVDGRIASFTKRR